MIGLMGSMHVRNLQQIGKMYVEKQLIVHSF